MPKRKPDTFGGFSLDELRGLVAEQQAQNAEADELAYTRNELMQMLNIAGHATDRLIDALLANDKLECVWVKKPTRAGLFVKRPAYRFKD